MICYYHCACLLYRRCLLRIAGAYLEDHGGRHCTLHVPKPTSNAQKLADSQMVLFLDPR